MRPLPCGPLRLLCNRRGLLFSLSPSPWNLSAYVFTYPGCHRPYLPLGPASVLLPRVRRPGALRNELPPKTKLRDIGPGTPREAGAETRSHLMRVEGNIRQPLTTTVLGEGAVVGCRAAQHYRFVPTFSG